MANGVLGNADLAAATNTNIYQVPIGKTATVNINICNRNSSPVAVRLALCATTTPADAEYVEYDTQVQANGVLERTGVILDSERYIIAYSDTADVSVVVVGVED